QRRFWQAGGTAGEQANLLIQFRRTAMKTNWPALKYGCLILASLALATKPAPAQTPGATGAGKSAAVISSVAITQAPERSAVRVDGEGKLEVRAARMQHPDRLVLDFVGARLAVHKTVIPGVSAPVAAVRMAQYQPDVARVVVDLMGPTSYYVSRDGDAVVISFTAPKAAPMGVSQKSMLTTSVPEEGSQPRSESSAPALRTPAEHSARTQQIPAPRFALPGELTQPSVALASFRERNGPASPEANPQQAAQQAIQQANTAATTLATSAAQTPPMQTAARYTGEPISVTRVLSYAKASILKDTLKKFISSRGDILSDDCSNTLIIRDIPSVIPIIDNLRAQLDRKSQQVEIEARVVSASRSFAEDIGTQLGFAGTTTGGRSLFGGDPSVGCSGVTGGIPPSPLVCGQGTASGNGITNGTPLNTNFAAGTPSTGFSFSHRSPNFALDFFISMAESKGVGKLLSKPKVITQNNEKATVKQGTKIPIQTTINNTISVQYIDAVLK